jgi:hemoglobin
VSLFDELGGDRLRAVLTDFYRRIFDDVMIGFLFAGHDPARLIEREWEMTARILGATDVRYQGRPLREAHARSPILGGHFDRRLQLLKDAMAAHDVPAAVRDAIVEHTVAMRSQVTADPTSDCNHTQTANRTQVAPVDTIIRLGKR